jgi:hypothetical protein
MGFLIIAHPVTQPQNSRGKDRECLAWHGGKNTVESKPGSNPSHIEVRFTRWLTRLKALSTIVVMLERQLDGFLQRPMARSGVLPWATAIEVQKPF